MVGNFKLLPLNSRQPPASLPDMVFKAPPAKLIPRPHSPSCRRPLLFYFSCSASYHAPVWDADCPGWGPRGHPHSLHGGQREGVAASDGESPFSACTTRVFWGKHNSHRSTKGFWPLPKLFCTGQGYLGGLCVSFVAFAINQLKCLQIILPFQCK